MHLLDCTRARPLAALPGAGVVSVLAVSCACSGETARTAMVTKPIPKREYREAVVLIGNSVQSAFSSSPTLREWFARRHPLDGEFRNQRPQPLGHLAHAPVLGHHVAKQD